LAAAINPQGRSIRPQQIQHWLAERLGRRLVLSQLQRQALELQPC